MRRGDAASRLLDQFLETAIATQTLLFEPALIERFDGPSALAEFPVRGLAGHGIQSKPYLPAIHLMSFYRERFGHREGEFPVCEDVAARSLALPFFPTMTEVEVERVAVALRGALAVAT